MKKLISILFAISTITAQADNSDCLGSDLTSVKGAGQAWFGPIGLIVNSNHPHIQYTPSSPVNTYVVHYGIMMDDPSTPGVNEAGQLQHITAPVWKAGTSDPIYREEKWWRCGLSGATQGYDLSRYSRVVLAVYVYKLGTNTNPIGKAECVLSRGN